MQYNKNIEYLCGKGFYGVRISEVDKEQMSELLKEEGVMVVSNESVEEVRRSREVSKFIEVEKYKESDWIRLNNVIFMNCSTKGKFKFNCSEYFFILHEVLTTEEECTGARVRTKLKIGAKNFFYFVKKLVNLGVIEKKGDVLRMVNGEVIEKKEEWIAPVGYYRNISWYKQILDMISESSEGVSSNDIRARFGMSSKQALAILKQVYEWESKDILCKRVFEGTIRRNLYKMKKYEEKSKSLFKLLEEKEELSKEIVDTEVRDKLIEELVLKKKVTFYSKQFYQMISDALRSKRVIDKNTVINLAKRSQKIDILPIHIKFGRKRITRHMLKAKEIEETDQLVINEIVQEGYKVFSIVTKSGVVDYTVDEETMESADGSMSDEESGNEGNVKIDKKEVLLKRVREYLKDVLYASYDAMHSAASNGYILSKRERYLVLMEEWRRNRTRITEDFRVLDDIRLEKFLQVFPISEGKIREKLQDFYSEEKKNWKEERYIDFLREAPSTLQKQLSPKNHIFLIKEAISDLKRDGAIEEHKEKEIFFTLSSGKSIPEEESKDFLRKEERESLLGSIFNSFKERDVEEKDFNLIKSFLFGVSFDLIKRSEFSFSAKKELISLFLKKQIRKTNTFFSFPLKELSLSSNSLEIYKKKYSINEVLEATEKIKELLRTKEKLDIFSDLINEDYFLIEYIIFSMMPMGIFSNPSLRSGTLAGTSLAISGEYKRALSVPMEYAEIFCISEKLINLRKTESIRNINGFILFKHLIHKGHTPVEAFLNQHKHISLFEVEILCKSFSDIFEMLPNKENQLKNLLILK
ncbi:hypothetical protein NEFER03_0423 [Nematocida sp. LUAm3]|nr:hypothetical protein NEFER03_0423 [Nematocida sp. LUAm3]KAI5175881.1 hypothetical protein NEFER02_1741 [Nematocida sp. LUAm2]KAI5178737.1 hypothetical protein NEFER01_1856 [Nematocida sp. LUAm1]